MMHDGTSARNEDNMLSYSAKVALLRRPLFNGLWRRAVGFRGQYIGSYDRLPEFIANNAPSKSFVDVGCMWGVDGEYAFLAEAAGATKVLGVDLFGPTPEFTRKHTERKSSVEFVLGDISRAETLRQIGRVDVVFCAGVLYHHPSPYDLLVALRRMCSTTLILRTSTIPEMRSVPNGAVYFPLLSEKDRRRWNLSSLGLFNQVGISTPFEPREGYGNWFWGLTPSALKSLVETAGVRVEMTFTEAFAQTLICTPTEPPFAHLLLDEETARTVGEAVAEAQIARPA